jgi:pyruvate dehydrogenase E2 component (dihydrolipoamide acetyltransferase)
MPTPVVMPQMGESIAEGTIVRWLKKVGDTVDRDEPLFEISTDKVDAEIPSPVAGVLTEITANEGDTVAVNSVVANIAASDEASVVPASAPPGSASHGSIAQRNPAPTNQDTVGQVPPSPDVVGRVPPGTEARHGGPAGPEGRGGPAGAAPKQPPRSNGSGAAPSSDEERHRQRSSPLVRRIAREHHVDITQIPGSGIGGRVTKHDILGFIESGPAVSDAGSASPGSSAQRNPAHTESVVGRVPPGTGAPRGGPGESVGQVPPRTGSMRGGPAIDIQPLSVMRKKIAEHMVLSRRTSAHVHSVFHVNFSTIDRIRQEKKSEYERLGAKLTYMAFIAKAIVDALRRFPIVNASIDDDNVIYKKDINLGIAVALEGGLIVPVLKHADEKNLLGLSRGIADLAERARAKQLKPDEVHDGTFTITNPGQFGAQFGMPIINQPQVAILGVGTIEKRPVVVDDAIAIRTMAYLTLGFDHRLIDGAVADEFMASVKNQLENFDANQV